MQNVNYDNQLMSWDGRPNDLGWRYSEFEWRNERTSSSSCPVRKRSLTLLSPLYSLVDLLQDRIHSTSPPVSKPSSSTTRRVDDLFRTDHPPLLFFQSFARTPPFSRSSHSVTSNRFDPAAIYAIHVPNAFPSPLTTTPSFFPLALLRVESSRPSFPSFLP